MLESIGNGILTGVVASICFSIIKMLIRPRIKVSPKIEISRGEKSVIKIKVVNKTWSMLTNLQYFLYYCVDYDDGTTGISDIRKCQTILYNTGGSCIFQYYNM